MMTQPLENSTHVKNLLHDYLEHADEGHISAIYLLVKNDMRPSNRYNEETLAMLNRRMEDDVNNNSRSYTREELFNSIRSAK